MNLPSRFAKRRDREEDRERYRRQNSHAMTSSRFIFSSAILAQEGITERTEKTEHTETAKAHPCVPFFPSVP